jgi:Ca2+-transporting ATPase
MTVTAIMDDTEKWDNHDTNALSDRMLKKLQAALLACPREPTDTMDVAIHALGAKQGDLLTSSFDGKKLIHAYGLRPDLFAVVNIMQNEQEGSAQAYAKGALEAIAELSHITPEKLAEIRKQVDTLAQQGMRVLGIAQTKAISESQLKNLTDSPRDLSFEYVGLIGFADPLRKNVPAAIAECRSAGIRVIMITGDYPETAMAIGKLASIDNTQAISGDEIEAMSDETLADVVKTNSIFARIRPNQKLRIVQSLKANGEIVGMTGDGVNDAPAIKAAHIGIAMGGRGTDVAREASAIVLLDDDFGAIVKTIRLGRRIYDNLRKAIEYIVAVHIPIAGLALLPLLLGLPMMLTPIHIAFLEMVIDPACSVVFEAEKEEKDVMKRKPRNPKSPLLIPKRILWASLQGLIVLAMLAGILIIGSRYGMPEKDLRALVFTCLVLMNMGLILVNRSFNASLASALLRPNRSLWMLLASVAVVLSISIFWAPARQLFHFGQLHANDLAICAGVGIVSLLILEGFKSIWFRSENLQSKS